MKTYTHLWYYLSEFFLEWEMFKTKAVKKCSKYLCENCAIHELMWGNMVEPDWLQMTV